MSENGARVDAVRRELAEGGFHGELLGAGEEGYDQARSIWNAMVDKRPGLIARAADRDDVVAVVNAAREHGTPLAVRYFAADHSVFIDNDYLIKGVAGSILWMLLNEHAHNGRHDFCNRELRRDPRLPLPDFGDNLETRLILLQRRLAERCPAIALEKTGRGRFRLNIGRPLQLSA